MAKSHYFCINLSKKSHFLQFMRKKSLFLCYFFTPCKSFAEKSRILRKKVGALLHELQQKFALFCRNLPHQSIQYSTTCKE